MAKGQKRSNKEIKKPKQTKVVAAAPAPSAKGMSASDQATKRKG